MMRTSLRHPKQIKYNSLFSTTTTTVVIEIDATVPKFGSS
jgi:hypothetical protein